MAAIKWVLNGKYVPVHLTTTYQKRANAKNVSSILTSIKYRGTEAQWNAISKGSNWNSYIGSYKITYNYEGE